MAVNCTTLIILPCFKNQSGQDPYDLHQAADYLDCLADGTLAHQPLLPIGLCEAHCVHNICENNKLVVSLLLMVSNIRSFPTTGPAVGDGGVSGRPPRGRDLDPAALPKSEQMESLALTVLNSCCAEGSKSIAHGGAGFGQVCARSIPGPKPSHT